MQKTQFYTILIAFIFLCNFSIVKAQLVLPLPSPNASITQGIGLTDISIDYSSPGVKDRTIWGDLVPYGELWRAGANAPTKISFSNDVMIEGQSLAAGTYTLMIKPNESQWEIIFNKDSKGNGVFSYDAADDVLSVSVTPETKSDMEERLMYLISAGDNKTGMVSLRWAYLKVSFRVTVDDMEEATANIKSFTGRMWFDLAQSALFYVDNGLDLSQATTWIEQSITMREHFYNQWVKSLVLEAQGDTKEAIKAAEKAMEIGEANPSNFFNANKAKIEAKLAEWK